MELFPGRPAEDGISFSHTSTKTMGLITAVFIISMCVFAIHYTMQEGEIFGIAQKIKLGKMSDPLRDCPVCMVPYYGTVIYAYMWGLHWTTIHEWIIVILCSLGLNAVLLKLFPDKETPGIHHELGEITDRLTDMGQIMQAIKDQK